MTTRDTAIRPSGQVHEYAGLRRDVEIGLAIAPTIASVGAAVKSLAAFLDDRPTVPVRLAGVDASPSRVQLILAITLGSVEEVKVAGDSARSAVLLLQRIVDEFAAYDPAFTLLPEPESSAAQLAHRIVAGSTTDLSQTLHELALVR